MFFRPLRLCIPAEQLRRARIALLKATHLPYIAAIWAYEGVNRYLASSSEDRKYKARPLKSPLSETHLNSAHRASRDSAARTKSDMSLFCKTPGGEEWAVGTRDVESITELKTMIEQLSTKVEELSQKIAKPDEQKTA